jgi:hypothetical protein
MKHGTQKKKKSWLRSQFHLKASPAKEEDIRISILSLDNLMMTKELKDILKLIEKETIPSVRDAWIEYFLEKTKPTKYIKSD